ncbi:PucR family transcriptional regulator ligand-binding domain-containing protein [Actinomadura flavalba]|uniref:PucR family transcriptional regulator ligand-binding domain-containing protein n=1 Tax=Actinomadura flavalba TaxID=1120938 RepID=UPI0003A98C56|nr:PucR family transcriptional regulator ligand-binding domain-containing protein [Actinomadura flavalba]
MKTADLLADPDLRLRPLACADALDRPVRQVFVTDLPDPSRYLDGGELVLTGLMWRRGPYDSVPFVAALAARRVAALAAGEAAAPVPGDLVEACERYGVPLVAVPAETTLSRVMAIVVRRLDAETAEGDTAVPASHAALLARLPEDARRRFRQQVLGAVIGYDRRHRSDLLGTLTQFLACSCSWTAAARALNLHVNTLRYRVRRIEQLTGRDLSRLEDRVDLLLAVSLAASAREGVRAS